MTSPGQGAYMVFSAGEGDRIWSYATAIYTYTEDIYRARMICSLSSKIKFVSIVYVRPHFGTAIVYERTVLPRS